MINNMCKIYFKDDNSMRFVKDGKWWQDMNDIEIKVSDKVVYRMIKKALDRYENIVKIVIDGKEINKELLKN